MTEFNEWNKQIIQEYRDKKGKLGGQFKDAPVLLLHQKGRKSGNRYVNPLMYQETPDGIAIFASKGGDPSHPDWYHNLKANPDVEVELGDQRFPARARELTGEERERVWEAQKKEWPQFAGYEEATEGKRDIPVLVLERA
jgi:deazaflavin-dependent oxidoreductase (nitroreductase family)